MENISFGYQVSTHEQHLYGFALNFTKNFEDANDLVQDTMIKALKYGNLYQEGSNLKAWLYTILKNTFLNDYKKSSLRNKVVSTTDDINNFQLLKSSSENLGSGKMISDDIAKAIQMLPANYSVPFLRHFEGYKYHEIADELNIPIGTVKTRIHAARQMLQAKLSMYDKKK